MMVTIPVQLTMRPTYDMHEYTGSHKQQIIFSLHVCMAAEQMRLYPKMHDGSVAKRTEL